MELSEIEIQGSANYFLSDHLPDRFTADTPIKLFPEVWTVEVILTYPNTGKVGIVGHINLDLSGNVLYHTPIDIMYNLGIVLCLNITKTLKEI